MPRLSAECQPVSGSRERGLLEVRADASIQRRVTPGDLHRPRAAEEVHVTPVDRRARFLFAAVADAEVHLAVFAFGKRDFRRHELGLLPFGDFRFDVRELKCLNLIELALAFFDVTEAIPAAGPKRELPQDNGVADARVAGDFDRTVSRQRPRRRRNRQDARVVVAADAIRQANGGVRVPVILHFVQRGLARDLRERAIERLPRLQRNAVLELGEMPRGNHIETVELDRLDDGRLSLIDIDRDVDGILFRAQLHIERLDLRVGITAVAIERRHAFEIGVEPVAGEVMLGTPRELRALHGRQSGAQLTFLDGLDTGELELVHPDDALLTFDTASGDREDTQNGQERV